MPRRRRGPLPLVQKRRGAGVTRQHWFFKYEGQLPEWGTGTWADAISRISVTGETLGVAVPEVVAAEGYERRRLMKRVHATVAKTAIRRGLSVTRHWTGEHLLFRVVEE